MSANPTHFMNARLVLPDEIVNGSVVCDRDGLISDLDSGSPSTGGHDCDGDYLIPGLVELHTDHLEVHYAPRPKVHWNPVSAVQAHDAQIACAGITTVFDALRVGMDEDADLRYQDMRLLADAIETGQTENRLRADHFIHLRCEVSAPDVLQAFTVFEDDDRVRLISLMDHTPGQRQFVSLHSFRAYYQGKKGFSDAEMDAFIIERQQRADKNAPENRKKIAAHAKDRGISIASHDDATIIHVDEAIALDTKIAEFPTTLEAAKASRGAGMAVLMGAPNVVRGGSHSGNVSARELAENGCLDVLSSDYVPVSLVQAAFQLAEEVDSISLPQAISKVTSIPAEAIGLNDRGKLEIGRRADLVQVKMVDAIPIVRGVWREGRRVA
ncbi:alpha-D-ribose 1-methylphosphonate 5-triphosphate diphosphatase [Roseibium hamelinense]|uniref:Alpha-D-ribose 1-methylphosphonate 5-triphosphate diphosphatase n=1 Tax=Roseibium hamelinense TaxID=150831 RepID=A0A562SKV0_9HYPH|nr:alpha-D-ribose 1-methylphosphonate 5-triphosphate diphosphatase [Roseibium hamelinense]MTI43464.1 alpha-D-ribose 1-methylphosphonate 5-triphosphate diphosphatase [Roseibium hamelinense]TWI81925.1 alpha-D-ribose 1-methylphosphonate 5-triphosphate diphosphatase [Roseibium hamelinense]